MSTWYKNIFVDMSTWYKNTSKTNVVYDDGDDVNDDNNNDENVADDD